MCLQKQPSLSFIPTDPTFHRFIHKFFSNASLGPSSPTAPRPSSLSTELFSLAFSCLLVSFILKKDLHFTFHPVPTLASFLSFPLLPQPSASQWVTVASILPLTQPKNLRVTLDSPLCFIPLMQAFSKILSSPFAEYIQNLTTFHQYLPTTLV